MPKKRKLHMRDIRYSNNAGMDYPVCRATDKLTDVELRWDFAESRDNATCERCIRAFPRLYPWAVRRQNNA